MKKRVKKRQDKKVFTKSYSHEQKILADSSMTDVLQQLICIFSAQFSLYLTHNPQPTTQPKQANPHLNPNNTITDYYCQYL